MALQYHRAAGRLLPFHQEVESPLYFLLAHAMELALKGYLRSRRRPAPRGQRGHQLRRLLSQCYQNGLPVSLDLQNVVQLLEPEMSRHGFRYFLFESTARPELSFLSEVVDTLMAEVEKQVRTAEGNLSKPPSNDRRRIVMKWTEGKPRPIKR